MLPAPKTDRASLADVLPSCLAALTASANRLELPRVDRAVVVLVDGLGSEQLRERAGHARTLAAAHTKKAVLESGFPTTTAAALASLCTGTSPGEHGLVGYTVFDAAHDRVVNQLTGWDARLDPATWQRAETIFERAATFGVSSVAVGPERYRTSGFTRAVLRGAEYRAAKTIEDRFTAAAEWLAEPGGPGLLYLYIPELDMAAHGSGWQSPQWIEKLEAVDAAVRRFSAGLTPTQGMILTADHGMVDVKPHSHVLIDADPALVEGIRHVAGDPRCLQLHFEPELGAEEREALIERWRVAESDRAWVVTRQEAIDAGWFGTVDAEVEPRIGDLLIAARKAIAYYDSRTASTSARAMVGQHGSWSTAELQVPLLRFGAFSR